MDVENRNKQRAELDRWIDAALRARADVEPRMGLEERVLARLATEPPSKVWAWRWAALVGAAAILAIALALLFSHSSRGTPAMLRGPQAPSGERIDSRSDHANATAPQQEPGPVHNHLRVGRSTSVRNASAVSIQKESLPKLATFPTPRPETAEERMLAQLAARRGSYELARLSTDLVPLKVLPVPEFTIQPLEEAPVDETPQE
jgi:hypothetical protein